MTETWPTEQRLFLDAICEYFHTNANWPTYDYLDRTLSNHDNIDVEIIGRSVEPFMYEGMYAPMSGWDPKRIASLSISALYTCLTDGICLNVGEDLEAFMQIVHLCIEKYAKRDETDPLSLQITSTEAHERFGWSDLMLRKVFELIGRAHLTAGSSSRDAGQEEPPSWSFTVSSNIRSYRRVKTLDDFMQTRENALAAQKQMHRPAIPANIGIAPRGATTAQTQPLAAPRNNAAADEDTGAVLAQSLVADTRGYIEKVVHQVNKTYDNTCYDACAVMLRRLVETLIIETFEANGIDSTIKQPSGEFMQLRDLVKQTLDEKSWNLGRNIRQALPRLKDIGDRSAHDRRYNAMRRDIDNIKDDLRAVVQELLYLAKLK